MANKSDYIPVYNDGILLYSEEPGETQIPPDDPATLPEYQRV